MYMTIFYLALVYKSIFIYTFSLSTSYGLQVHFYLYIISVYFLDIFSDQCIDVYGNF
jgi:hypothetical protein